MKKLFSLLFICSTILPMREISLMCIGLNDAMVQHKKECSCCNPLCQKLPRPHEEFEESNRQLQVLLDQGSPEEREKIVDLVDKMELLSLRLALNTHYNTVQFTDYQKKIFEEKIVPYLEEKYHAHARKILESSGSTSSSNSASNDSDDENLIIKPKKKIKKKKKKIASLHEQEKPAE